MEFRDKDSGFWVQGRAFSSNYVFRGNAMVEFGFMVNEGI